PKFISLFAVWAAQSASFSPPARRVTHRKPPPFSRVRPPMSSSPIQLTTPITSEKPSPRWAPKPSSRTILLAPASTRSTVISTLNVISLNAASAGLNSFAGLPPASKRQRKTTSPSSPSQQPCYGSGKCPHDLERDDFFVEHDLFRKPAPTF